MSISRKLKLVIMLTTSVALLLACTALVTYDLISERRTMAVDLSTLAKVIGTTSTATLAFRDSDSANDLLSGLSAKQNIAAARLSLATGEVLAEFLRDPGFQPPEPGQNVYGSRFYRGYLIACEPIVLDSEVIGTVYLVSDLGALHDRIGQYFGVVALVLCASLLVAFLISSGLQRMISAPILHLAQTARAVSVEKDYTIRATRNSRDELGTLIDVFNEMLGQIQERDARLQTARNELELRVEQRTKELQDEIAERERIEQVLRRSEEHFRSLIENATEVITVLDLDGTIRYESPSVERVMGYKPDELIGRNANEFSHPDDEPATSALMCGGLKPGDSAVSREVRFKHRNGEWRTLEVFQRLTRQDSGSDQIIINSRDITERKAWEATLRESEQKYRTILESIQEGYYEVDLSGGLTFFNDSLSRIMGTPAEKMRGLKHRAYTDPETEIRMRRAFEKVFRTGEPLEGFQYEILTLEGLRKSLESSISLRRDSTGLVVGFRGFSREITERKLAEKALRESEERYRALFDAASDAIIILDAEGNPPGCILAANRAAAETTGYTVDELLNLNIAELRLPEDAAHVSRDLRAVLDGLKTPVEISRLRKDGSTFPIEVNASPVSLGDRRCVLVFARDMTKRKQMEKEATMLAHTVRSIQECVSITDTDHHILFVNDAFIKTYGFERDELLGNRLMDLVRVTGELTGTDNQLLGPGPQQAWEGELINRRKDGTLFPINLRVSPIHDESGQTIALAGIAQDITERKKIEKEVSMLAHSIRSIRESVCITDSQDSLLFVNDAFLTLYGYERNEVIGKNIFQLVRVTSDSPHAAAATPSPETIRRWEGELFNRRKDGSEFPIHLSSSPICDETGETIALVGVIQDVTDSRRAVDELRKAKDAAEAASSAKSEFLANMSHEIRTPMNGIIGMTELALDTVLTTEQTDYLTLVKLSADSLLGVINDVLDFSKIEAGKLEIDLEEFNLQDAVDGAMKALSVRADQKGLELAYYLRPDVPELIIGDAGRLRQILINLVGNAIKFTERGEVIVRVEAEPHNGDHVVLRFSIRDTGIGVPLAKQKIIFESFTQADGSTTRKYGGTGLGLAISSQLVEMMGGEIWIESPVIFEDEIIPGSVFHFTARFGVAKVRAVRAPYVSELAGLPVLVVDDNSTNRRILEVQLTNWHMKPTGLDNPVAVLDSIRQAAAAGKPFKLALIDFHMPDMDGLTLAAQIKTEPVGRDLRIILLSSSVQQSELGSRDRSIDARLLKPVKAADLLTVIKGVMGRNGRANQQKRKLTLKSAHPGRVLLAEDNPVNQQLIKRLLEKWGHNAIVAHNGTQAIALLEDGQFDCVLMDLQMPEINGFEATAVIRARERVSGRHIPIIALTAHALKEDRQRCIDAGMDDYVSKPIDAATLFEVIEAGVDKSHRTARSLRPDSKKFDIDALVLNFEGDIEMVATLGAIFAESSSVQLSEIGDAIARGDAGALAFSSHALKGSVANFYAQAAVDAASTLERMARSGDIATAESVFTVLKAEIQQLREELKTLEEVSLS